VLPRATSAGGSSTWAGGAVGAARRASSSRAFAPDAVLVDAHGGQRRLHHVHQRHVVVAGDGHLPRAAQAVRRKRPVGIERKQVVGGGNGREAMRGQQPPGGVLPGVAGVGAGLLDGIRGQAGVLHRGPEALRAQPARGHVGWPGQVADAAVAEG